MKIQCCHVFCGELFDPEYIYKITLFTYFKFVKGNYYYAKSTDDYTYVYVCEKCWKEIQK